MGEISTDDRSDPTPHPRRDGHRARSERPDLVEDGEPATRRAAEPARAAGARLRRDPAVDRAVYIFYLKRDSVLIYEDANMRGAAEAAVPLAFDGSSIRSHRSMPTCPTHPPTMPRPPMPAARCATARGDHHRMAAPTTRTSSRAPMRPRRPKARRRSRSAPVGKGLHRQRAAKDHAASSRSRPVITSAPRVDRRRRRRRSPTRSTSGRRDQSSPQCSTKAS